MSEKKNLHVNCPKCKKLFSYYASDFRPFCSERCKDVDMGHWLTENYKVASKEKLSEEDIDVVESHFESQLNEEYGKES